MQKEKIYTVQEMEEGVPRITIRGKWLHSIGIGNGTKLKYVEGRNMIILIKVPEKEAAKHEQCEKMNKLERQINFMKKENALAGGF